MNGSGIQLLWAQHHQLVHMMMSHTGGNLTVIHIDILANRETSLQHSRQSCPDAPKQFHQINTFVWWTP